MDFATGTSITALASSVGSRIAQHGRLISEASTLLLGVSLLILDRPTPTHSVCATVTIRLLMVLLLATVAGMLRGDVRTAIVGATIGIAVGDLLWFSIPLLFFGDNQTLLIANPFALIGAVAGAVAALSNAASGLAAGFATSLLVVVVPTLIIEVLSVVRHSSKSMPPEGDHIPFEFLYLLVDVVAILVGMIVTIFVCAWASSRRFGFKNRPGVGYHPNPGDHKERIGYSPPFIVLPITLFIIYWTALSRKLDSSWRTYFSGAAFSGTAWIVALVVIAAVLIVGIYARRRWIQRQNRVGFQDVVAILVPSPGGRWLSAARGAALFVFVAATIYLGWWTRPAFLSSRARLAAEALHKLGVQLNIVSWPYFNTDHLTDAQLRSISTASLFGGVVQDSDLALLKDLPGLVTVQFGGPNFSDACLVDLASVKSLKTLWATQTRITGQGFTNLRGLYNLETLYLDDSPIDDAGLTGIGVMRNLKIVHLDKTRITDAGLDALRSLDHCEELYLTETEVGDGVVQLVENMPSLRVIALYQTRVTGQGLDKVNRILAARRTTPIPLQPPATP